MLFWRLITPEVNSRLPRPSMRAVADEIGRTNFKSTVSEKPAAPYQTDRSKAGIAVIFDYGLD
jgi:hypothetical protein